MTDIEIARSYKPLPLQEIAKRIGLSPDELYPHGRYKGKVALAALDRLKGKPQGRYILVTAINPTPLGEGKTTTSIGLAMGLCRLAIALSSRFDSLHWDRCLASKAEEREEGMRKLFPWRKSISI